MLYLKDKPVGIDSELQSLQTALYVNLLSAWGLEEADYACYGRAYRTQRDNLFIPEAYKGNGEYKDVLLDDSVSVLSFFSVGNQGSIDNTTGYASADVGVIFWVNVAKAKPTVLHHADEEVRRDVQYIISRESVMYMLTEQITSVDSVFSEYDVATRRDGVLSKDMHPWHCFRFNMTINYANCV